MWGAALSVVVGWLVGASAGGPVVDDDGDGGGANDEAA